MAIRFKQDRLEPNKYSGPKYKEYHRGFDATIADRQKFSSATSPQNTVPRHNQFPRFLTELKLNQSALWRKWSRRWDNFNFRTQLAIVLVGSAAISTAAVTSCVVNQASHRLSDTIQKSLQSDISLLEQSVKLEQRANTDIASSLAQTVSATGLDLTKKSDVEFSRELLTDSTHRANGPSFRIITDAQGKTVAQDVQILNSDFSESPQLPQPSQLPTVPKYRTVTLPYGIKLKDIPIVRDALKTGRLLTGTEVIEAESLSRLGLEKQADIGFHFQEIPRLSDRQKPFMETQYPTNGSGLVIMAVQPIKNEGKIVGAVIVGTLLNRNYQIVDEVSFKTGGTKASLFAYDSQISTNVPDPNDDDKSRAIGTRVSMEVADSVLEQGQEFSGKSNLLGQDYLSRYIPLWDHTHQLSAHAKPAGIAFVGKPDAEVLSLQNSLSLVGYGIGGGVLLIASLAAAGISSVLARPMRRLADFAGRVREGERDIRLEADSRQNEVGILTRELNWMSDKISGNETILRYQDRLRASDAKKIQLFFTIPLRIRESFNVEDILQTAVQEVHHALRTERVLIYRFDNLALWSGIVVAESVVTGRPEAREILVQSPQKSYHQKDYRYSRIEADESIYLPDFFECEIHTDSEVMLANLVAPILVNNQVFGLLISHDYRWRKIPDTEFNLFAFLATQTGIALEQATLLEEVELARIAKEVASVEQRQNQENLQRQLLQLIGDIGGVSSGDLTVRAEVTEGEIGTVADIFNATVEGLHQLVTQVKVAATQVKLAVGAHAAPIFMLTDETFTQAAEITRILDQLEQMTQSMQAVANNASSLALVAQTASRSASNGESAITQTVQRLLNLRQTVTATTNHVKCLGESSQQISKTVFSINQISLQTNVLAINASIEAARAGEAGRGFGLVADEVSKLAAQSAAATREIEQLVENIQRETSLLVRAMDLGTTQVIEVTHLAEDTKKSLAPISDVSHQIDHLVQSISTTTMSQAQISELVSHCVNQLALKSERTSNSSRQLADDFQQTVKMTQQLQAEVNAFKVGVES